MKRLFVALGLILLTSNVWATGSPVKIDEGDTLTNQADVTVTSAAAVLIRASNSSRTVLNCTTNEAVRWGPATVTTASGQSVSGGSAVAIRNTGAVYMIAEVDTATVSCTEESNSSASGPIFSP